MANSTQCGDVVLFLRQTPKHSETMFLFHTISMSCTIPYWIFIFTSAYTHRVLSHVLKSKRLTRC